MNQHLPRVRIVTQVPDRTGLTLAIFNRVTIDDKEWPIVDYHVEQHVDGVQQITLTFLGDVTIEHKEQT